MALKRMQWNITTEWWLVCEIRTEYSFQLQLFLRSMLTTANYGALIISKQFNCYERWFSRFSPFLWRCSFSILIFPTTFRRPWMLQNVTKKRLATVFSSLIRCLAAVTLFSSLIRCFAVVTLSYIYRDIPLFSTLTHFHLPFYHPSHQYCPVFSAIFCLFCRKLENWKKLPRVSLLQRNFAQIFLRLCSISLFLADCSQIV